VAAWGVFYRDDFAKTAANALVEIKFKEYNYRGGRGYPARFFINEV